MQKGLFLLWQVAALPHDEAYDFKPYDYGPVAPEIYSDTSFLLDAHLLRQTRQEAKFAYYRATSAGREAAADLAEGVNPRSLLQLEVIRSLLTELQFDQVVSAIYAAYPEYSVATIASDLLPGGRGGAHDDLAKLFTREEIRFRADTLWGMRQIERGQYVSRDQMASILKNGS
jgi:hypothetical protein